MSTTSLDTLYTASSASETALPTATSSPANTPPPVPSRSVHTTITRNLDAGSVAHSRYGTSSKDGASKSPQSKRAAPAPPSEGGVQRSHTVDGEKAPQGKKAAPAAPASLDAFSSLCLEDKKAAAVEPAPPEPSGLVASVPKTIGAELIELVRRNTHLSYELSRVAIGVVIGHIQSSVPVTSGIMEQILISVVESKVTHAGRCWLAAREGHSTHVKSSGEIPSWRMEGREVYSPNKLQVSCLNLNLELGVRGPLELGGGGGGVGALEEGTAGGEVMRWAAVNLLTTRVHRWEMTASQVPRAVLVTEQPWGGCSRT